MKPREYCCCAIPMVNAGIYATLIEQFGVGILIGALSVATPSSTYRFTVQSFATMLIPLYSSCWCCYSFIRRLIAWNRLFRRGGFTSFGFYWCSQSMQRRSHPHSSPLLIFAKEKPSLYQRYVTLHGIILCAAFAIAAAWIIVSATRHDTATSNCLQKFFSSDASLQTQGERLCDIFSWVDVGIMGGIWLLLGIVQVKQYLWILAVTDWFPRVTSSLLPLFMVLDNGGTTNNMTPPVRHIP